MSPCDARGDALRERHHVRTRLSRRVDDLMVVGESTDPRPSITGDGPVPVVYAYGPSEDPGGVGGSLSATGRSRIAHTTGPTGRPRTMTPITMRPLPGTRRVG
ncbi:hypothetical protein [Streptosporangium subroseum]|uniref:hypothetical protein n=1 Tax=Streptosporangium subroseum TaxID=106412 RepID=UPI0030864326|nr:hypothetical protein OHB15_22735 [Streptosporangium subroseum]